MRWQRRWLLPRVRWRDLMRLGLGLRLLRLWLHLRLMRLGRLHVRFLQARLLLRLRLRGLLRLRLGRAVGLLWLGLRRLLMLWRWPLLLRLRLLGLVATRLVLLVIAIGCQSPPRAKAAQQQRAAQPARQGPIQSGASDGVHGDLPCEHRRLLGPAGASNLQTIGLEVSFNEPAHLVHPR
jgi:hypothetical protein